MQSCQARATKTSTQCTSCTRKHAAIDRQAGPQIEAKVLLTLVFCVKLPTLLGAGPDALATRRILPRSSREEAQGELGGDWQVWQRAHGSCRPFGLARLRLM